MLKNGFYAVLMGAILTFSTLCRAESLDAQQLYSPTASRALVDMVYKLNCENKSNCQTSKKAILLMSAAQKLDQDVNLSLGDMVEFANLSPENDYSDVIYNQLLNSVTINGDIYAPLKAAAYLLQRQNTRTQREEILKKLESTVTVNDFLLSDISFELGGLATQISDKESAKFYFIKSYKSNHYNTAAFEMLLEYDPNDISYSDYGIYLRRKVTVNPFDIDRVLDYADFCHKYGMYSLSVKAYAYALDLYDYQMQSAKIPRAIYIPYAEAIIKSDSGINDFLKLSSRLRQAGVFDLELETLSAINFDATKTSGEKLIDLANIAEEGYEKGSLSDYEVAWFYCFGLENTQRASELANKAYLSDPNNNAFKSLYAYTLSLSDKFEAVDKLVHANYESDQVASLAYARALFLQDKDDLAIDILKAAVAIDPASIVADKCRKLLEENNSEFVSQIDPIALYKRMKENFNDILALKFEKPKDLISVKMGLSGTEFDYNSRMVAKVTVTNLGNNDIVISDESFINGNLRIDAILSGDISLELPEIVLTKFRPGHVLEPGNSIFYSVDLSSTVLSRILESHPQAEINIDFTTYLDPVLEGNKIVSALGELGQIKTHIQRNRVDFTRNYLLQRMNALEKGTIGQKIAASQLFAGILTEQEKMGAGMFKYSYKTLPPELLYSALSKSLREDSWETKVNVIKSLTSVDLDFTLVNAISTNLNDSKWPLRLVALDSLARVNAKKFTAVLDWVSKSDSNEIVRDYAKVLLYEANSK